MLWVYINNQGDVGCKVNVGNRIRQGNPIKMFVVLQGMQNNTAVWSLNDVGWYNPDSDEFSYIGSGNIPEETTKTFELGDPSEVNSYFQNGISYNGYEVEITSDATNFAANGGHVCLSLLMLNQASHAEFAATFSVFVEPTRGNKVTSITADDYANLVLATRKNSFVNLGELDGTEQITSMGLSAGYEPFVFSYGGVSYFGQIVKDEHSGIRTFEIESLVNSERYVGQVSQGSSISLSSVIDESSQYYKPYALVSSLNALEGEVSSLIPSQTGNAGKFLSTNGSSLLWDSAVHHLGAIEGSTLLTDLYLQCGSNPFTFSLNDKSYIASLFDHRNYVHAEIEGLSDASRFLVDQGSWSDISLSQFMDESSSYYQPYAREWTIAPNYDSTETYDVDELVMHNHQLYRCTTAISTAEAWTPAHWQAVSFRTLYVNNIAKKTEIGVKNIGSFGSSSTLAQLISAASYGTPFTFKLDGTVPFIGSFVQNELTNFTYFELESLVDNARYEYAGTSLDTSIALGSALSASSQFYKPYANLVNGKVPASELPSYVDDVIVIDQTLVNSESNQLPLVHQSDIDAISTTAEFNSLFGTSELSDGAGFVKVLCYIYNGETEIFNISHTKYLSDFKVLRFEKNNSSMSYLDSETLETGKIYVYRNQSYRIAGSAYNIDSDQNTEGWNEFIKISYDFPLTNLGELEGSTSLEFIDNVMSAGDSFMFVYNGSAYIGAVNFIEVLSDVYTNIEIESLTDKNRFVYDDYETQGLPSLDQITIAQFLNPSGQFSDPYLLASNAKKGYSVKVTESGGTDGLVVKVAFAGNKNPVVETLKATNKTYANVLSISIVNGGSDVHNNNSKTGNGIITSIVPNQRQHFSALSTATITLGAEETIIVEPTEYVSLTFGVQ